MAAFTVAAFSGGPRGGGNGRAGTGDSDEESIREVTPNRPNAPPNSRLFVVCAKTLHKKAIEDFFSTHGVLKQVFLIKEKQTREFKGCAFVTFTNSSSALTALEAIQDFSPLLGDKPIKAHLAREPTSALGLSSICNKKYSPSDEHKYMEDLRKLRVNISATDTEESLKPYFAAFGKIEYLNVIRSSPDYQSAGLAYIKYQRPSMAAKASEGCQGRFLPLIAANVSQSEFEVPNYTTFVSQRGACGSSAMVGGGSAGVGVGAGDSPMSPGGSSVMSSEQSLMASSILGLYHRELVVQYDSSLSPDQLFRLFDIVPGFEEIRLDSQPSSSQLSCVFARYKTPLNALYAKEKLNGFEYPLGKVITVSYHNPLSSRDGVITASPLVDENPTSQAPISSSGAESSSSTVTESSGFQPGFSNIDAPLIPNPLTVARQTFEGEDDEVAEGLTPVRPQTLDIGGGNEENSSSNSQPENISW